MSLLNPLTFGTVPGKSRARDAHSQSYIDPAEGKWMYFPGHKVAQVEEFETLMEFGSHMPYYPGVSGGPLTETKENSGTIANISTGLRLQSQASPSAADHVSLSSILAPTLAVGKIWLAHFLIQVSHATDIGFRLGFVTGAANMDAAPDDGIFFNKVGNSANVTLGVVGTASGTISHTGTIATAVAATNLKLGMCFSAGSTTDTTWGFYTVDGGAPVAFTATQLETLSDLVVDGAPALTALVTESVVGTTQRNAVLGYGIAMRQR